MIIITRVSYMGRTETRESPMQISVNKLMEMWNQDFCMAKQMQSEVKVQIFNDL